MAELMAHRSHTPLEGDLLKQMQQHFSESELVELGVYFALVTGFQKFNEVFQIFYACEG